MATYLIGNIKGPKGADGVSPKAKVEQVSNGAMITITDAAGTTSALVRNGVDGDGNNIDLTPYATWVGLDTAINEVKNDYATKEDVETAVAGVNVPVTSVNGMVGEVVIPAPDLTPYATQTWVDSQNYLKTAPVSSVNGETGEVVLSAADIGALPADTAIPTKTSELTNDSNYVSASTLTASLATKQDALTAGSNITIENNVISATGGGVTLEAGTATEIDRENKINVLVDGVTLGVNANNQLVSYATGGTTYTAGNGIGIDERDNNAIYVEYGDGLKLSDRNALEIDDSVVATKADLGGYVATDDLPTYNAGDGILIEQQVATRSAGLLKSSAEPTNPQYNVSVNLQRDGGLAVDENGALYADIDLSDYATQRDLAEKQDTLTAGNNITIDSNNQISVNGLELSANSENIQGATNTTTVSGGKVDISVAAAGNELGSITLDAEQGGMFGESAIYNKTVSLGMAGLDFGDTASGKNVVLAPNANYDGFTINGVDIPMTSGGGGSGGAGIREIKFQQGLNGNIYVNESADLTYLANCETNGYESYPWKGTLYSDSSYTKPIGSVFYSGVSVSGTTMTAITNYTNINSSPLLTFIIKFSNNGSYAVPTVLVHSQSYLEASFASKTEVPPTKPSTDGTYFLTTTVSSGTATQAWVSIPAANGNNF